MARIVYKGDLELHKDILEPGMFIRILSKPEGTRYPIGVPLMVAYYVGYGLVIDINKENKHQTVFGTSDVTTTLYTAHSTTWTIVGEEYTGFASFMHKHNPRKETK